MTEKTLKIPPVTITVGLPFQAMLRLEDTTDEAPVLSLTGYTVAWLLSAKPFDTAFASGTGSIVTDTIGDHAYFEIDGAATALFGRYALPIIGGRPSALLQVTLTSPVAANSVVLQGPATIQGIATA